jgi:hypothetical protein
LATIKAKSEALKLRQEFELEKFRAKYRAAQVTAADSPHGHLELKNKSDEKHLEESESSEADLSIKTEEAFDEPLKVFTLKACFALSPRDISRYRALAFVMEVLPSASDSELIEEIACRSTTCIGWLLHSEVQHSSSLVHRFGTSSTTTTVVFMTKTLRTHHCLENVFLAIVRFLPSIEMGP